MTVEWRRDDYLISTDPARLDVDVVHAYLNEHSYCAEGVPRDVVERSIAGSIVLGLYNGERQVGFARVVTDRATFAWLCDVFVLPDERDRGLGKWLVECAVAHPDLQGLRRFMLGTRDAHGLYAQYGFTHVTPERYMQRLDRDVYKRPR